MSEAFGHGDCRDECMQYAIESDLACESCLEQERIDHEAVADN